MIGCIGLYLVPTGKLIINVVSVVKYNTASRFVLVNPKAEIVSELIGLIHV